MKKTLSFLMLFILMATLSPFSLIAAGKKIDELQVVLPGTVQGALGAPNWAPAGSVTQMQPIGDGQYEFIGIFPKGAYEYKVAIGGSWEENYGKNGVRDGGNILLNIPENNYQVRFIFDYNTKIVKDSVTGGIKAYRVPKKIAVKGLELKDAVMKQEGNSDFYKLTVNLPKGSYSYQVQYDGSEKMIFGAKGENHGAGINLNLEKATTVTFTHNLTNNVTYDSVNYIPVSNSEIPTLTCKGLSSVKMDDTDKDNVYTAEVTLPKGKETYNFEILMGGKKVGSETVNFNEVTDNYKIKFQYDHKAKTVSTDYVEKLNGLDGKVIAKSLYFDSRNPEYKSPFGAVVQGTNVTFTLSAKANDLEKARVVVQVQKIEGNQDSEKYLDTIKYPMTKTGVSKDGSREFWTATVKFPDINVYSYYFEAVDGKTTALYGNNMQVIPVPHTKVIGTGGVGQSYAGNDDKIIRYTQSVYDPEFKTPDWAKDAIFYYVYPDRFKNGDKTNDPKQGVTKFYGNKDIEFHKNWTDKKPWTPGNEDGNETDDGEWCNDFYGGDLAGVIQKLDYLKELGVNTLYFNPLFEANTNHKYDTADYKKIDDSFGTNEEFKNLLAEANKRGIRIIMDASLNHSSSDSIYMDRYGKYEGLGAFENEKIQPDSPYADWYTFNENAANPDNAYKQWANPTLATFRETDSYKDFAYRDKYSVTKFWLNMGTGGWRMDVTPWKSDSFWREWRTEVKKTNPDALTLAETWFDSSKYLLGDQFDSTMNYIFRQAMLDYANGGSGKEMVNALEMMRENYPAPAFNCLMNLLSTHDAARALYQFGYKDEGESQSAVDAAKQKLMLSLFFQMTYPGAPTIYYGDEVGMTGGDDPYNRGPFPWMEDGGTPDNEMLNKVKVLTGLRNKNAVLRRGDVKTIYSDENVIVMLREYADKNGKKTAIVAVNNSNSDKTVTIDVSKYGLENNFIDPLNNNVKHNIDSNTLSLDVPSHYGKVLFSR